MDGETVRTHSRALMLCATAFMVYAAASARAGTQQSADPISLLQRIYAASQKLSYTGTFVYQHGGDSETSRITRIVDASGAHERLETLDGVPREILRTGDDVVCYLPASMTVKIDNQPGGRSLPALLPDTLSDYSGNRQGYPLKEIFDEKDPRLVLVNRDDFFEKPSPENGLNCIWVRTECFNKPKFEAAYPGQRGIILLSRIGYNSDRTQALVTTMITNEQDTGKTYIILLAKENGQWKIADRYEVTWII